MSASQQIRKVEVVNLGKDSQNQDNSSSSSEKHASSHIYSLHHGVGA
jgi:hypothetical protein